jgi:hypothetical protein
VPRKSGHARPASAGPPDTLPPPMTIKGVMVKSNRAHPVAELPHRVSRLEHGHNRVANMLAIMLLWQVLSALAVGYELFSGRKD